MPITAKRILVPVDASNAAEETLRLVCQLAKEFDAKVHALYVIEVGQEFPLDAEIDAARDKAEKVLDRIEALAREEKCFVDGAILQARHAGPAIIQDSTERKMDMIAIGVAHTERFKHSELGEVVTYVLQHSSCPVLIWKPPRSTSTRLGG